MEGFPFIMTQLLKALDISCIWFPSGQSLPSALWNKAFLSMIEERDTIFPDPVLTKTAAFSLNFLQGHATQVSPLPLQGLRSLASVIQILSHETQLSSYTNT